MVDINETTILGYAITPWLILFGISIAGIFISAISIFVSFIKKDKVERAMLESAVKTVKGNTADNIVIPTIDFGSGDDGTESIYEENGEQTEGMFTRGFADKDFARATEGFADRDFVGATEGFADRDFVGATEGFQTEGFVEKTDGFGERTERFAGGTEHFDISKPVDGATEGLFDED